MTIISSYSLLRTRSVRLSWVSLLTSLFYLHLYPSLTVSVLLITPGIGTGGVGPCVPTGTNIRTCPDILSALTIVNLEPYETIQLQGGSYSGLGNINLQLTTTNVTLLGSTTDPSNRSVIVLNSNNPNNFRWLTYVSSSTVSSLIQDIDITNGYQVNGTGAGILYAPTISSTSVLLTLNRVNFINCTSNGTGTSFVNIVTTVPNGNGGALASFGNGLVILNSQFINNNANNNGGAVYHGLNDQTIVINSTFTGNTVGSSTSSNSVRTSNSNGGGAVVLMNNANVTYTNVQFNGNTVYAGIGGGAFLITGTSTVTLTTNSFNNNQVFLSSNLPANIAATLARGGAILTLDTSNLLIQNNCQFMNNNADSSGGAFETSDSSTVTVLNSVFTGNSAGNRGGTARFTTTNNVFLINSTLSNSYASQQGGFLQLEGPGTDASLSVYTVQGTSFYNGSSLIAGGCIWTMRDLTLRIQYSTLSTCVSYSGGAIYAAQFTGPEVDGFLGISQNTIISYSSATNGAAVYVENGGTFHISDSSITLNSGINGVLTAWSGSNLLITNSMVQSNNAIDGAALYVTLGSYAYVSRTSFFSNSATNRGGVAYVNSDITFEQCDSIGNSAGYGGVFSLADNNGAICRNFRYINGSITSNTATSAGGVFWIDQTSRPCITNIDISQGTVISGNAARYYGNIRASKPTQFSLLSPNSSTLLPLPTAPSLPVTVSVGLVDVYLQAASPPNIGATITPYFVRSDGGLGSFAANSAAVQYSNDVNATTVISNIQIFGFPEATVTIGFRLNPPSDSINNFPPPLTVPILLTNCPSGTQLINSDKGIQFNYCGNCNDNFYNLDPGGICKPCPSVGISCIQGEIQVQRGYYAAAVSSPSVSSSLYSVVPTISSTDTDTPVSVLTPNMVPTIEALTLANQSVTATVSTDVFDTNHILDGWGTLSTTAPPTSETMMNSVSSKDMSSSFHDSPYPRPLSSAITLLDVSPCRYNGCCNQPLCPFSNQCPAGRTGFQCADCTTGYISVGEDCILSTACTSTNSGILALAYFVAAILTLTIIYTTRFHNTDIMLSSLFFLFHITYFLTADADPWLRHITGTLSLNIRELYYLLWNSTDSCIGPWDDITLLSIPYAIPGFMYSILTLIWLLHTLFVCWKRRTDPHANVIHSSYTLALHRITVGCCAVLINTSVQLVSCASYLTLNANGSKGNELRLLAAPSVQCYSGKHLPVGIIAWIILIGVGVVWPLILWIALPRITRKEGINIYDNLPIQKPTTRTERSAFISIAWILPYRNTMRPWAAGFFTLRRLIILLVAASLQFSAAAVSTALIFVLVIAWVCTVRFAPFDDNPKNTLAHTGRTIDSWTLGALVMMSHLTSARIATINDPMYSNWGDFQNILFIVLLSWFTIAILMITLITHVPHIGYYCRQWIDTCTGGKCCGRSIPLWLSNAGKEWDPNSMDTLSIAYLETTDSASESSSSFPSKQQRIQPPKSSSKGTVGSNALFISSSPTVTTDGGNQSMMMVPGWAGTDKVSIPSTNSDHPQDDSTLSTPPLTPTIILHGGGGNSYGNNNVSGSNSISSANVKINPLASLNAGKGINNSRTVIPPIPVDSSSSTSKLYHDEDEMNSTRGNIPLPPGTTTTTITTNLTNGEEENNNNNSSGSNDDTTDQGDMSEREKAVRKMMG